MFFSLPAERFEPASAPEVRFMETAAGMRPGAPARPRRQSAGTDDAGAPDSDSDRVEVNLAPSEGRLGDGPPYVFVWQVKRNVLPPFDPFELLSQRRFATSSIAADWQLRRRTKSAAIACRYSLIGDAVLSVAQPARKAYI
jgi:hypothetical protein